MTTTLTDTNVQQLTEHIRDWQTADVVVDQSQRMVRNIALTGLKSKNGYRYSEQALRRAIPLYEHKPVFLDHAANLSRPYDRSTRDLVGSIVNPRFDEGRIRGDIHVLDTESGRTFMALADAENSAVGMSHVVLARRTSDKSVVEKIHDVVSVDAVVFPAATSTFRENRHEPPAVSLAGSLEAALAEIDATLPDHFRRLAAVSSANVRRVGLFADQLLFEVRSADASEPQTYAIDWTIEKGQVVLGEELTSVSPEQIEEGDWLAEWQRSSSADGQTAPNLSDRIGQLQTELDHVLAERDELRKRVDRFELAQQAAEEQQQIDRLLVESKLPAFALTDAFRQQLIAAADAESRQSLINERRRLLEYSTKRAPLSRERLDRDESETTDAIFVSAIRRGRHSVLTGVS